MMFFLGAASAAYLVGLGVLFVPLGLAMNHASAGERAWATLCWLGWPLTLTYLFIGAVLRR